MDNYVTGYPVLICAMMEIIALGWIYGITRLRKDLKLMSGKFPSMYWSVCFLVLTPLFTTLGVVISVVANSEVVLNDYHYPAWAHGIGWSLVAIILSPLVIIFIMTAVTSKFDLEKMFEPAADWLPAIPLKDDDDDEFMDGSDDNGSEDATLEVVASSNMGLVIGEKKSRAAFNFHNSNIKKTTQF